MGNSITSKKVTRDLPLPRHRLQCVDPTRTPPAGFCTKTILHNGAVVEVYYRRRASNPDVLTPLDVTFVTPGDDVLADCRMSSWTCGVDAEGRLYGTCV